MLYGTPASTFLHYSTLYCFGSTARERAKHSGDYFTLLRHLLNYAYNSNINVPNAEVLLNNEIDWLKRIRDDVKRTGETGIEETILEGHLGVTKELLAFQTSEKNFILVVKRRC